MSTYHKLFSSLSISSLAYSSSVLVVRCYLLQWIKSRYHWNGYTHCLLEKCGGHVTVEQLISWLDKIGNLSARDALCSEYESMNIALVHFVHCM